MDKNKLEEIRKEIVKQGPALSLADGILRRDKMQEEVEKLNKKARTLQIYNQMISDLVIRVLWKQNTSDDLEKVGNDIINMITEKYYKER